MDHDGHISRCGDGDMRIALYEAASAVLTRSQRWSALNACGLKVSAQRGHKRAVVMHRMWVDGSDFRFTGPAHEIVDPATARCSLPSA